MAKKYKHIVETKDGIHTGDSLELDGDTRVLKLVRDPTGTDGMSYLYFPLENVLYWKHTFPKE